MRNRWMARFWLAVTGAFLWLSGAWWGLGEDGRKWQALFFAGWSLVVSRWWTPTSPETPSPSPQSASEGS